MGGQFVEVLNRSGWRAERRHEARIMLDLALLRWARISAKLKDFLTRSHIGMLGLEKIVFGSAPFPHEKIPRQNQANGVK